MIRRIATQIGNHELFEGLSPSEAELIAGCSKNVVFSQNELLLGEGDDAGTFYLVRRGRVALELHRPGGGPLMIETVGPGGAVGWSWLFPPYRWHFDARALEPVGAIAIDGECLRGKAESDPAFGYELIKRFAAVMVDRLNATQLRLLDVYGNVDAR